MCSSYYPIHSNPAGDIDQIWEAGESFQMMHEYTAAELTVLLAHYGYVGSAASFAGITRGCGELNETELAERIVSELRRFLRPQRRLTAQDLERIDRVLANLPRFVLSTTVLRNLQNDLVREILMPALRRQENPPYPLREELSLVFLEHLGTNLHG